MARRGSATLAAASIVLGAGWSTVTSGASAPPEPAPTVTAVVMAQRTVELADGPAVWSLDSNSMPAATTASINLADPSFVVATAGTITATDPSSGDVSTLSAGEAVFLRPGVTTELTSGPAGATYLVPGLWSGDTATIGAAFTPGAGPHDLDLWGDAVVGGESTTLPASDDGLPSLVVVIAGQAEATVVGSGGPPQPLTAGIAASFTGSVEVRNTGADLLRVAALTIGSVDAADLPATSDAPATTEAASPTTAAPPPTTAAPPQTTAAPPQTTAAPPQTTAAPPAERAPSASDDSNNATDAPSVSVNVLSNDDLGDPTATITALQAGGVGEDIDLGNGHFQLNSNGTATLSAIAPPGATTTYSTTYTITNSQGSSTATVTLSITSSADD